MVRPLLLMVFVAKAAYWTSGSVGGLGLDRTTEGAGLVSLSRTPPRSGTTW